jgi:hypothetical protein
MWVNMLPLDFTAIRKAIIAEMQRVTGVTCILAQPETTAFPRPARPYMSMFFTQVANREGDDSASPVTDSTWNVGGQRGMVVDFNSYGRTHEEAYGLAVAWQCALEGEETQAALRVGGVAVWLNGSVADLSELLQTGYEGRARLEVHFGVAVNRTEDRGAIEDVTVNGTVTTDQGIEDTVSVNVS